MSNFFRLRGGSLKGMLLPAHVNARTVVDLTVDDVPVKSDDVVSITMEYRLVDDGDTVGVVPFVPEPEPTPGGWVEHVADPFVPGEDPVGMAEWPGGSDADLRPVDDSETLYDVKKKQVEGHFAHHRYLSALPGAFGMGRAQIETLLERMADAGEIRRQEGGTGYERLTEPEPEPYEPQLGYDFMPLHPIVISRRDGAWKYGSVRFSNDVPPRMSKEPFKFSPLDIDTCDHNVTRVQAMVEDGHVIMWEMVVCDHRPDEPGRVLVTPWWSAR